MKRRRILVLSPHADDESLGMAGTIARLTAEGAHVTIAVLTGPGAVSPHPVFPKEVWDNVRGEARKAFETLGVSETIFENLPAVMVGDTPAWEVNKVVDRIVRDCGPDELYAPFPFDMHRDHRELFHAASVAWRPSSAEGRKIARIFCYEVMSETHWNAPYVEPGFLPQRFVDITATLDKKIAALRCFASQMQPFPSARSIEAVTALAALRGAQAGVRAAEAFVVIREFE